jgi:energy-converting hydrogenase Eha subunit B
MATAAHTIYPNRFARRLARLAANRRLVDVVYCAALVTFGLALAAVAGLHGAELLKSSGVIPSTGAISGLSTFITNVISSVKWYAGTIAGLSAVVIAAMFISGHQSAHSHGMRVGFGIIALVCIPGLVA